MSASVHEVLRESSIRAAELSGYESISSFVRDAICEKIQLTFAAMSNVAREQKVMPEVSSF